MEIILRLHREIKFRPCKTGQFSMWYFFGFVYIFFSFPLGELKQLYGNISSRQSGIMTVKKRDHALPEWNLLHVIEVYDL